VSYTVDPAGKCIVVNGPAAPFQPSEEACASVTRQLELHRSASFLLHDHCACPDFGTDDNVADFALNYRPFDLHGLPGLLQTPVVGTNITMGIFLSCC
jgi:hypothetical protein